MPTLNDLPAELLLEILSYLGLRTTAIWRFIGISKVIYEKTALLAYRKELRSLYSEIDWCKNQPPAIYLRTFRTFLRTIIRRHDLAAMVQHLALASGWRADRTVLYERTKTGQYVGDEELFLDAAARIGFAPDSEKYKGPTDARKAANRRAWRAFSWAIQSSLVPGELILLLSHLPNLESLCIDVRTGDFRLPWGRLLRSSTNSLSKLKHLKLFGHPGGAIHGDSDLSFLFALPELRSLEVCDMSGLDSLIPSSLQELHIKDLTLHNCTVDGKTLRALTTRIRSLECFTFFVSKNAMFYLDVSMSDLREFIAAQQSTLQSLFVSIHSLHRSPRFEAPLGSLGQLTQLKNLTLSLNTLIGTSILINYSDVNLRDYLPRSLQKLHITKPFPTPFERIIMRFAVWLKTRAGIDTFPDLKTIRVDASEWRVNQTFHNLGIEVVVSARR